MNATDLGFSKIINIDQGAREHYHVPKYQREYTWGKRDWERLVQDIDENDPGYFMGSIICVKDGEPDSPGDELIYEVVDGQQRLATLSLMMMAIYQRLNELREGLTFEDEDDRQNFENTLASLRNKLVKKKRQGDYRQGEPGGWVEQSKMCFFRVQPSGQNHNLEDYRYILGEIGVIKAREKPRYHGNRSICRAYRYFQDAIAEDVPSLLSLVSKINQLKFVYISVDTQADAFTLFETLNNRGVPLSAIDIIKNKMLAEMERQHQVNIDASYEQWQEIITAIPDASDQERFLRHFYNAFRWDSTIRIEGIPRAIKSKIIAIYETLIKANAQEVFGTLCQKAALYGKLIDPENNGYDRDLRNRLTDLVRVYAAPSYQVLLYLFSLSGDAFGEPDFLSRAIDLLRRYYVRRNVTDYPGTRSLDQIHMDQVAACQTHINAGERLSFEFFRETLLVPGKFAARATFEDALRGSMYSTNTWMTRYLLVKLDEAHHTREYAPDLWARNDKGIHVWSVEHVMPQSERIASEWVDMVADGDEQRARQIHEKHVHRLGNLTLSGYNSKLATAPFDKKQALAENRRFLGHQINIGYKNGMALNKLAFAVDGQQFSLADAPRWTADMIEARTDRMVKMLLDMYTFEGVDDQS